MASSTFTGLNVGRKYTGMPAHAIPSTAANPMMWATGRPTTASSWRRPPGQMARRGHAARPGRVGELGALGLAGGARRVEERGDVVGLGRHRLGQRLGAVDLVGPVDHQRGAGVADDVVDLVRAHLAR